MNAPGNETLQEEMKGWHHKTARPTPLEDEREWTAAALWDSEERCRILMENAREGIVVIQGGKAVFANEPVIRSAGVSWEELTSVPFVDFFHAEDRERIKQGYRSLDPGGNGAQEVDCRVQIRDGEARWVQLRFISIPWKGAPAALTFVNEVTEQKQAPGKIVRLTQLYSVLSKMNEAIFRMRDPEKLHEEACRIAVEEGLFRMAWVGFLDRETLWVKPAAKWGIHEGYLEKTFATAREDIPEGCGARGRSRPRGTLRCVQRL